MATNTINVTFTLEQQIELILGNEESGLSNSIIPNWCAEILIHKIPANDLRWKITQETADDLQRTTFYVLWQYKAWAEGNSRRDKAKAWQEKIILEGWLESENVTRIANAIMAESRMDEQNARRIANQILKKGKDMNQVLELVRAMFGIEKLATKKEDL